MVCFKILSSLYTSLQFLSVNEAVPVIREKSSACFNHCKARDDKLMNNFGEKVNFIWSVADLIRDTFKRSRYQDVILPLTVLRRIDCVLQPTKEQVPG